MDPPRFPTNPLDMRSLCTRYSEEDTGVAHIYLLRYQTPPQLMELITQLTFNLYPILNGAYSAEPAAGLLGLGYFRLSYNGNGTMSAQVYDTNSIQNVAASIGPGKPTLTSKQFLHAGLNVLGFSDLVRALVYKAFLELFIQRNMQANVAFSMTISIDLYERRNSGAALGFHKDATAAFPTRFFTLAYIIENPNIILKGPTIVTAGAVSERSAVTPAVRHGTTIGIDNTAVLHATPDQRVNIAPPGAATETLQQIRLQNEDVGQFRLKMSRDDANYAGPELSGDLGVREDQVDAIRRATRDTQRSFIRIWYNVEGFPMDPGATMSAPLPLGLTMEYLVPLGHDIINNTCFVETGIAGPPEGLLGSADYQAISLGGAEPVVNAALKPLEYEQKSKPSIKDVVASPEFQKLVASPDNFILGTIVKGNDKGAALPMGGKQVARSKKGKKRTMKRVKRSSTRRRMVRRKQKTQIRTKRTKTRR